MNFPLAGIIIDPQGVSVSVTVTDDTGATATVYSDRYGMSQVSLPATISSPVTYYMPGEGPWTVTPTVDGAALAGKTVRLEGQQVATVTVPVTYARSTQLGAYVPITVQPSGGDDLSALNAAVAATTLVQLKAGTYHLNSATWNCTDKPGLVIKGMGKDVTTIVLNNGGIGVDGTGSRGIRFEDLTLTTDGSSSASTVGVLLARSSTNNFVEYARFANVKVKVAHNAAANSGNGSVGIYNNAAEIAELDHCELIADWPEVRTGNNVFGISSGFVTHYTGATSMSTCKAINTTFNSISAGGANPGAPSLVEAGWDHHYDTCYWTSGSGLTDHCIETRGDCRGLRFSGNADTSKSLMRLKGLVKNLQVDADMAMTAGSPCILLDQTGTNNGGISGGRIVVNPGSAQGGDLISDTGSSGASPFGVRDCDITLKDLQTLTINWSALLFTGNTVRSEDSNPTISLASTSVSYSLVAADRVSLIGGAYLTRSQESPAYAASYTPNWATGETKVITLTGNITVNAPTNGLPGAILRFIWVQDGTGGRTISYNGQFHTGGGAAISTAANTITNDTFYTNDGSNWRLVSRITGQ